MQASCLSWFCAAESRRDFYHAYEVCRETLEQGISCFDFFLTLVIAPVHIFYDGSCHAYTGALLREPLFFMNSRFFVDKFHWRNHVNTTRIQIVRLSRARKFEISG